MKRPILFGAAMLVACAVMAPSAQADDTSEIKAVIGEVATAFKKKDIKMLMATSTEDFSLKQHGQIIKGKQAEAMMKEQFAMIKSMDVSTMKCDKIKITGKTAEALCSSKTSATLVDAKGQMGKPGATHKMVSTGTSKVDLVKGAKGWKIKYVEDLTDNTTLDGKKMEMGGPPPPAPKKK